MIADLPRREREILEILCGVDEATAADVRAAMSDAPSDSAVRTLLARLEAKKLIKHREQAQTYVYAVAVDPELVMDSALKGVVDRLFKGSGVSAAMALLGQTKGLKPDEVAALQAAIDAAKRRRR